MSKGVVVINNEQKQALTMYTGTLFSDIDFQGLNGIIDKIAENKEELTDGMREAAAKFADDWDRLVVSRLTHKKEKLEEIDNFFSSNSKSYNDISHLIEGYKYNEFSEGVAHAAIGLLNSKESWKGLAEELEGLVDEFEEMEIRHKDEEPDKDEFFQKSEAEMTYSEIVIAQKEYEIAKEKFYKKVALEQFEFRKKFVAFRKKMRANKELVEFTKAVKAQLRASRDMTSLVHEKASLVKMAINFGGTDLLKALQELHEFQKTL